jgi:hypothetical protein
MDNRTIITFDSNITCARSFDWASVYDRKSLPINLEEVQEDITSKISVRAVGIMNSLIKEQFPSAHAIDYKDLALLRKGGTPPRWEKFTNPEELDLIKRIQKIAVQVCKPDPSEIENLVYAYTNGEQAFKPNSTLLPTGWTQLSTENQDMLAKIVLGVAKNAFRPYELTARNSFCNFNPDWANEKAMNKLVRKTSGMLSPVSPKRALSKESDDYVEKRIIKVIEEMAHDFTMRRISSVYIQAMVAYGNKAKLIRQTTDTQHGCGVVSYQGENVVSSSEGAHWSLIPSFKRTEYTNIPELAPLVDPNHPLYNNVMNGAMELPGIFNRVDFDTTDIPVDSDKNQLALADQVQKWLNLAANKKMSPYEVTESTIAAFDDILTLKLKEYNKNLEDLIQLNRDLENNREDFDDVIRMLELMSQSVFYQTTKRAPLAELAIQLASPEKRHELRNQCRAHLANFETKTKQAIFAASLYQKALDEFKVKKGGKTAICFSEIEFVKHLLPNSKSVQAETCKPVNTKVAEQAQTRFVHYWERDDIKSDT